MAAGDTCANCKHAAQITQDTEQGQIVRGLCRRYPPMVQAQFIPVGADEQGNVRLQTMSNTFWPTVNPTDTCGEHAVDIQVAGSLPLNNRRAS
jgi:hypothetical protein